MSKRLRYQQIFAKGKIVNLGCGEDPAGFGENAVHVDGDVYNHKHFVQADLHDMPMFKTDQFDTAILGDVLEHTVRPADMIREAGRIAKVVVATVFEEWRLPSDGGHIEWGINKKKEEITNEGFDCSKEGVKYLDYLKTLPTVRDTIVSVDEETVWQRQAHLYQFTDELLLQAFEEANMDIKIFKRFNEYKSEEIEWDNWLVIASKRI